MGIYLWAPLLVARSWLFEAPASGWFGTAMGSFPVSCGALAGIKQR